MRSRHSRARSLPLSGIVARVGEVEGQVPLGVQIGLIPGLPCQRLSQAVQGVECFWIHVLLAAGGGPAHCNVYVTTASGSGKKRRPLRTGRPILPGGAYYGDLPGRLEYNTLDGE